MQIDRPIAIALILFMTVVFIFFLVMPEYKNFRILQLELGKKVAEYAAEYEYYSAIGKIYYDLQNRQEEIKKIDDALPTDPDVGKIIYFIQKTAIESGMTVKGLFLSKSSSAKTAASKTIKTNEIKDIIFSLNVSGGYTSLERFMISLEKSSRVFEINTISFASQTFSPVSEEGEEQQVQSEENYDFNLSIITHSY